MSNGGGRRSLAETGRMQGGDGKLANLAKRSPCWIYLLGTILGKPTDPEIESIEIPRSKFRSGQKRQRSAERIVALRAVRAQTPRWLSESGRRVASLLLYDRKQRARQSVLYLLCGVQS